MNVGEMRMRMQQRLVMMPVAVRFAGRIGRRVSMSVMFVVVMQVFVIEFFVNVIVFVSLRQMQPDPDTHERSGNHEPAGNRLA